MSLLAKWWGLCLVTLVMGLAPIHSTSARDLTKAEQASLAETVDRFDGLMKAQDWPAMLEMSFPPRMMEEMLKGTNKTKEQMLKGIADYMSATMAKVKMLSQWMDLAKAEKRELADGTPYLLIPSDTVMQVDSGDKIASHARTLGMMDGGKWYLLRVSDAEQMKILVTVYPEYEGIELPGETREVIKE